MLSRVFVRQMASLAEPLSKSTKGLYPYPNHPRYKKLMTKQTLFCAQDGKMVWQKLPADGALYRMTIGLVSLGFLMTVHSIWFLATPPKND